MDLAKVGSVEAVTFYCIVFVLLAPTSKSLALTLLPLPYFVPFFSDSCIVFTLMQGFIGIREGLTSPQSSVRDTVRHVLDM